MRSGRVAQLRVSASSDAIAIMWAIAPAMAPATLPPSLSPIAPRTPTRTASARANFQAERATAFTIVLTRRSSKSLMAIAVMSSIRAERAVCRRGCLGLPRQAGKGLPVLLVLLIEAERLGNAQEILADEVRHGRPVARVVGLERLQRQPVGDEGVAQVAGGLIEDSAQIAGQRVLGVGHALLIAVRQHGELVVHLARLDERIVPLAEMNIVEGQENVHQHLLEIF